MINEAPYSIGFILQIDGFQGGAGLLENAL